MLMPVPFSRRVNNAHLAVDLQGAGLYAERFRFCCRALLTVNNHGVNSVTQQLRSHHQPRRTSAYDEYPDVFFIDVHVTICEISKK